MATNQLFSSNHPTPHHPISIRVTMKTILTQEQAMANNTPVTHVRLVAHEADTKSVSHYVIGNHWSIYLLHADNMTSTRVNLTSEHGEMPAVKEWTRLDYNVGSHPVRYWDFQIEQASTVAEIAHHLLAEVRDEYVMTKTSTGKGCQEWA